MASVLVATERLRFVRRKTSTLDGPKTYNILQQYWEEEGGPVIEHPMHGIMARGEWRDVPVEDE